MSAHDRMRSIRLRTPEGAEFSHVVASPLLRLGALLIDFCTIMVVWSLARIVIGYIRILSGDVANWVSIVGYFVLSLGYDMYCEWQYGGKTLGKRVLSLRVVDASGMHLAFSQILLRNLLRYVDILPLAYFLGGLCSFINAKGQRLGDLAAGTMVVYEPALSRPDLSLFEGEKYNTLRQHAHIVARLRQSIPPAQAQAAWQALRRAKQFTPEARVLLFAEIAQRLRSEARIPEDLSDGLSDEVFVRNVVEIIFLK